MKKTHWEIINSQPDITSIIAAIKKAVELTDIHDHKSDLQHIDCVYKHIEGHFPAYMKQGPNPQITMLRGALFYHLFKESGAKIYSIAEEFSRELSKVNINVRADCIPADNEIICIELPSWSKFKSVYIGTTENPGQDSTGLVYRRLELQFCYGIKEGRDTWERVLMHFHSPSHIIDDAKKSLEKVCSLNVDIDLIKFVINAYLYIHSGQPDLRTFYPPKRPERKGKAQRKHDRIMEEGSAIPVTVVGFNFKKPVGVVGHFQGYWIGTGRKNLEIKWKDPYTKGES